VRRIAPAILGTSVHVPTPAEYVALGAARQAAWTLSGAATPPSWTYGLTTSYDAEPTPEAVERYRMLSALTSGQ
jgi:xylulokinase